MKALSFSQPWLWAILDETPEGDRKRVENRRWRPPEKMIGQRFALHAAKSWDADAIGFLLRLGFTDFPARRALYKHSAVLGVATLDRVVTNASTLPAKQARWFFGPFGLVLRDVHRLASPVIEIPGALGFWTLPPDIEARVVEQLPRAE
jgi:hypothetical protein